jgi:hypothetical protein
VHARTLRMRRMFMLLMVGALMVMVKAAPASAPIIEPGLAVSEEGVVVEPSTACNTLALVISSPSNLFPPTVGSPNNPFPLLSPPLPNNPFPPNLSEWHCVALGPGTTPTTILRGVSCRPLNPRSPQARQARQPRTQTEPPPRTGATRVHRSRTNAASVHLRQHA